MVAKKPLGLSELRPLTEDEKALAERSYGVVRDVLREFFAGDPPAWAESEAHLGLVEACQTYARSRRFPRLARAAILRRIGCSDDAPEPDPEEEDE